MCGFAGYIREHLRENDADILKSMTDLIAHRGPDDSSAYLDEGACLGFRRLSIIDLEAGRQPMKNEDGSLVLTFNGEIYNFRELREELTELARSLNIADRVELPGRSTALLEKMNTAAMFVLSSDYEGMPNVLLEAMCMGMPCVSTDCPSGGPRELIENGVNGLLVPVGDVEALHRAMERMADPVFAKKMADAAYGIREELTSRDVFVSWYRYLFGEEPKTKD